MGRQRGPRGPRWRQLLRAGGRWLLWLSGMAFQGLRWLWRLAWYLLICYKSCWDGAFQVTEELGTVLRSRLESGSEGSEEEDRDATSALEPGLAVVEWQRRGDASEAVLGRLEALEADVRFLCTELGAEKLLWSSRFLELLREQQGLRQRLQERPRWWDGGDSPELLGEAEEQSASGSEEESPAGIPAAAAQRPRERRRQDGSPAAMQRSSPAAIHGLCWKSPLRERPSDCHRRGSGGGGEIKQRSRHSPALPPAPGVGSPHAIAAGTFPQANPPCKSS
ncbi:uncharacterized protein LOC128919016 [Rissa tridactyla]|uniref:uncharacterized protein LOC128919016 n=1 Tax=Rissa tridactyla TaxID=75485 RepID=UPI0023BAAB63|nr:uncharacterized protein LOC128919016 [Rissa tridactyla]